MRLRTKKLGSDQVRQYIESFDAKPKKYNVGALTRKPCFTSLACNTRTKKNIEKNENASQHLSIINAKQKVKKLYEKLLIFYQTNENKLLGIIKQQIIQKNYYYSKEMLEFLKLLKQKKQVKPFQFEKFLNDLQNMTVFLQDFYKKKCLRQIEIIQQSILDRQVAVREATDYNSYKLISKNVRPTLLADYDIYQEFKNISDKYGNFKQISNVQRALYQRMYQSQKKILKVFKDACILKQKDKFLFKKKAQIQF